MASIGRLLLSVLLLGFVMVTNSAHSDSLNLSEECAKLLSASFLADSPLAERGEEELEVLAMREDLSSLISKDPAKNLAVKNPFMIMNAAQRVGVLVRANGTDKVRIQGFPQEMTVFNVVSKGGANGKRIIGQEASVETIFNNVDAQAMGDRSAASIPLQVGSHGSGKSETIQVLKEAFKTATATKDSPYAIWTFEWTGMKDIPEVVELNPRFETQNTIKAALDDSPVLLLPKEIQQQVIANANDAVLKMTQGRQEAMPFPEMNPQDWGIREKLLLHYQKKKGSDLTAGEIITILNKHTKLRRVIWDEASGTLPVVDAQGDDVDVAGIFLAANPIMRVEHGPSHLFSWEPAKVLKGHGNVVFLDEVLRNPKELLRLFLRIFQERKIGINGSPDFPLDTVFITATNTSSLNELLADPNMHALVDRFLLVDMPWPTNPQQIMQILFHNYAQRLKMQKLPSLDSEVTEEAPLEPADMSVIFPRGADPTKSGPDYRYKLVLPIGDREIKFSPHAIKLMAYIISATRVNTDEAKAKEVMPTSKLIGSQIFRDPISRIRFEEGKMTDVPNGEIEDLRRLSRLLDEGSEGVASRDGGRWLGEVVSAAQRPENGNSVTPDLVFKVYMDLLGKRIKTPDNKTRLKWLDLSLRVATQLIAPEINKDVTLALAADQASIKGAYYDIIDEMGALYRDPRAKIYKSSKTNEEKSIDTTRLAAVGALFQRSQGRKLDVTQIAMYTMNAHNSATGDAEVMHDGLVAALGGYYAELSGRMVAVSSLAKLATTGEGGAEVRSQLETVLKNMKKLGYDQASAIAALRFKGRIEALIAEAQPQQ